MQAAALQLGHELAGDARQVVGGDGGAQPGAGRGPRRCHDARTSATSAAVPVKMRRVAAQRLCRRRRRGGAALGAASARVVEEHERGRRTRAAVVVRPVAPSAARTSARIDAASPVGPSRPMPSGVTNTTSAPRAASRYGDVDVRERGDQRLALRRARRDRRAAHGEVRALEVDVVQLVPVDEPPGGGVADLGVVLPRVPQPALHLDVVGGLAEQRLRGSGPGRGDRTARTRPGPTTP